MMDLRLYFSPLPKLPLKHTPRGPQTHTGRECGEARLYHWTNLNTGTISGGRSDLKLVCQDAGIKIKEFVADYDAQLVNGGVKRATQESTPDPYEPEKIINFAPDATFVLKNSQGKQALFFMEIDEGTEKIESPRYRDFMDKLVAYASYCTDQRFKRHGERFTGFRVLVVTKNKARVWAYRQSASKIGIKRLAWFTTFDKVSEDTILGKIWKIAVFQDDGSYGIL